MSECVNTLSYDPETQQLTIVFQKRGTYLYYDVSLEEYERIQFAGSQGYTFNQSIRDIKYFEKIG